LVAAEGADSILGTVIADRYLVQEKLGAGGMGEVYLAEHVRIRRKVAVKLMRKWMTGDPVAVSRFHREAENASQISHPNVAQVYDFGETSDGSIYLAMEYVPGEPLSAILHREGRLNAVRSAEVVRQTAEALVAAHAHGILHRDLKPDNVMVARTRVGTDLVKLVDFGIARVMNSGTQQFTSTGMIVGTPDYMSPEQLAGDALDVRSDLYALALIAFRCLTGQAAFAAGATGDALIARLMNTPRKLAAVRPEVAWPAALQAAFDKALHVNLEARHADALEFAAELDGAIGQLQLSEEEQAYLILLSQRMATPARMGAITDATPRSVPSVDRSGGALTPPTGAPPVALATPPSESRAAARPPRPADTSSDETVLIRPERASADGLTEAADVDHPAMVEPTDQTDRPAPTEGSRAEAPTRGSGHFIVVLPDDDDPEVIDARGTVAAEGEVAQTPSSVGEAGTGQGARPPTLPIGATMTTGSMLPPVTPTHGRRRGLLLGAGLAGIMALAIAIMPGDEVETPTEAAAIAPESAVETRADSVPSASPELTMAAADSERVQRTRAGVVGLSSSAGRGSAFWVDSSGLLLTSASLVPADQRVELFVDADHVVRPAVLHVDSARGVAVLQAPVSACRRCRPVNLGADDSVFATVEAGDSLLAFLSARRTSVTLQAVVVRAVGASIGTVRPLAPSTVGAPVITSRTGHLAGLVVRSRASQQVVPAADLRTLVATVRAQPSRSAPNDTVYRTWSLRPVAETDLAAAVGREADLATYRVVRDGYDVLVMTPQVLAWRVARSAPAAEPDNPFAIPTRTTTTPPDPILAWTSLKGVRDERRAVVVLHISPERAAYPQYSERPLEARRGDVLAASLTRDGTTVAPLESQRIAAVGNPDVYRGERRPIPNSVVLVVHPADLVPATATFVVEIVDADTSRRVRVTLPAAMLQAIARDVGPWQR